MASSRERQYRKIDFDTLHKVGDVCSRPNPSSIKNYCRLIWKTLQIAPDCKKMISKTAIKLATEEFCTCGGSGPHEGCAACDIYHYLKLNS